MGSSLIFKCSGYMYEGIATKLNSMVELLSCTGHHYTSFLSAFCDIVMPKSEG